MPILSVAKNGEQLCVVGSDDVWMFSASVWADIWGPEGSALTVTGGSKRRQNDETDFLIWEMQHELNVGDRITFSFEEGSISLPKGRKIEDEPTPEEKKIDFFGPVPEEEIIRLESRPALNAQCSWRFKIEGGVELTVAPDTTRQSVGLHLLWNEERPQRMRVNLSKSSLREITSRTGGEEVFLEYVPLGTRFEIAVGI